VAKVRAYSFHLSRVGAFFFCLSWVSSFMYLFLFLSSLLYVSLPVVFLSHLATFKVKSMADTFEKAKQHLNDGLFEKALSCYSEVVCESLAQVGKKGMLSECPLFLNFS
jgi:cobalamin biosynthesis protein CobD/CbiB